MLIFEYLPFLYIPMMAFPSEYRYKYEATVKMTFIGIMVASCLILN